MGRPPFLPGIYLQAGKTAPTACSRDMRAHAVRRCGKTGGMAGVKTRPTAHGVCSET